MPGTMRRALWGLTAVFLLYGISRLFTYGVDLTMGLSQFFWSIVVLIWAASVYKRVTDRRLRDLLLAICGLLLAYLLIQHCRYNILCNYFTLRRWLWYAFYVPLLAVPLLCLAIALLVHTQKGSLMPRWYWVWVWLGSLLVLGILTNDLHFQFVRFPSGVLKDNTGEKNGWLKYAAYGFQYGTYLIVFGLLAYKSRSLHRQKYRWVALLPLALGIGYFILYPLKLDFKLGGFRIYNIGEMLVYCLICALEACIQTGMIPANTNYEKLFSAMDLPAAILDLDGRPRYVSGGGEYPFPEREGQELRSHSIPGGSVRWAVDAAPLLRMNRELTEAIQQIETRNAYLSQEAQIRKDRAELETSNRIYDRIVGAVQPQLDQISRRLRDPDLGFDEKLRPIAVLCAFIKRRSNMELLAGDGVLPVQELELAVRESLSYLRLLGVRTAVSAEGSCALPAGMVIAAYEQLEQAAEDCMDTAEALMVRLEAEEGRLCLRVMLHAESAAFRTDDGSGSSSAFSRTAEITKDGPDMLLVFTYTEGGGAT